MPSADLARSFLLFFASVLACTAQVLAPPEILDPEMRALQQKHFTELKAAAEDITSHHYPYRFALSRSLGLTERQQAASDQRSIRFANFEGHPVLQVTGNYFAAYSGDFLNRNERVKRTYLDVMLPILRATEPRVASEPLLYAIAMEVSEHVRKQVMGVTVEKTENVALVVPRAVAEKVVMSTDVNEQLTALIESRVFLDGNATRLWPQDDVQASGQSTADDQPHAVSAALADVAPEPAPAKAIAAPAPVRDLSAAALQQQQTTLQPLLDRLTHELDAQAHFVSYAPPALIAFHRGSWLQLSITTTLPASEAGSQYRTAALAFDEHVSHLIRPVLAYFKDDPAIDGIDFSATVKGPASESVEFFLRWSDLRRYEQYDMTGQELIGAGLVLVNGERIGLDLQTAESERR